MFVFSFICCLLNCLNKMCSDSLILVAKYSDQNALQVLVVKTLKAASTALLLCLELVMLSPRVGQLQAPLEPLVALEASRIQL